MNNIIDYASTLPLFSQAMYLASFEHPNANIVDIITQRLASEDAPLKKAFCFKILLHAPMSKNFYAIAAESITTTNLDLELAAIRLLAHSHVNEALVLLEHLLSHPLWQIRALALSCLIDLKASINNENLYRLLNDPVNEVRIQAKKALDHLGKQELHAVSQDLQIDSLNYESEDYSIMLEEANK
ncbi:MAG: HEAT repeat domain-containing protein [Gammaproteobacteria bacterium]